MKEGLAWTVDEQGFIIEFADQLADYGDLLHLGELTARLAVYSDHIYELEEESDAHLVAGYTNCMHEAIRYLVEEEQYSVEHPVVQGLRQHLLSQQERVLQEALLVHPPSG